MSGWEIFGTACIVLAGIAAVVGYGLCWAAKDPNEDDDL